VSARRPIASDGATPRRRVVLLRAVALAVAAVLTLAANAKALDPPVAAFSFAPATPEVGAVVSFDASASTDPGGAIATYTWSFGDGTTGSGQKVTHRYAAGGDQAVTLTVTALDGRIGSTAHTVHVNIPPVASFAYAPVGAPPEQDPLTPLVGQQVTFDGSTSSDADGAVQRWAWDLGSGQFSVLSATPKIVTTFSTAGVRDIRLRVTDDRGQTTTAKARLRVNTPPVAGFDLAPAAPTTGATVTFTSTASDPDGAGDPISVSWDLNGDGTYADGAGATAKAVFLAAGTYTIGQRVIDGGGAVKVATKTMTVAGPPAPPPPPSPPATSPPAVVASPGGPVVVPLSSGANGTAVPAPAPQATTVAATSGPAAATTARSLPGVRVLLAGSVTASRTRISRIVVVAPRGALVAVRCAGKGCPKKGLRRRMATAGQVRVKVLERTLWSGARIVVSVAKPGYATREVVLTMRRGRAPARSEGCLVGAGAAKKVGPCPPR
jgi:hypothetical protein